MNFVMNHVPGSGLMQHGFLIFFLFWTLGFVNYRNISEAGEQNGGKGMAVSAPLTTKIIK